jgi:hypothetical protein
VLNDRKLSIDAVKPFRKWSGDEKFSDLRAFVKDVRTLAVQQDAVFGSIMTLLQRVAPDERIAA